MKKIILAAVAIMFAAQSVFADEAQVISETVVRQGTFDYDGSRWKDKSIPEMYRSVVLTASTVLLGTGCSGNDTLDWVNRFFMGTEMASELIDIDVNPNDTLRAIVMLMELSSGAAQIFVEAKQTARTDSAFGKTTCEIGSGLIVMSYGITHGLKTQFIKDVLVKWGISKSDVDGIASAVAESKDKLEQ